MFFFWSQIWTHITMMKIKFITMNDHWTRGRKFVNVFCILRHCWSFCLLGLLIFEPKYQIYSSIELQSFLLVEKLFSQTLLLRFWTDLTNLSKRTLSKLEETINFKLNANNVERTIRTSPRKRSHSILFNRFEPLIYHKTNFHWIS